VAETVYLDYAATTPVDERVVEAMLPYLGERFGNPNSLYGLGREAHAALEDARASLARSLGAGSAQEIVFTGNGTEADNAALVGIARGAGRSAGHVIVSSYEHHAVLAPAAFLSRSGFEVQYVSPRQDGLVYPEDLRALLRDDTVLVSVMHANNELGTVNPVRDLAALSHESGALFHTDAAQTLGKIPFDVETLGVDAASFSAHKVYAPKGMGALYLRAGTPFEPYLMGGGQESKRRSGTQNVAGAVAMARAVEIMLDEQPTEMTRLAELRDRLLEGLRGQIEEVTLNGSPEERLPNIVNVLVAGVEGESMLLHLDNAGFAVSTGSACSSASLEPSHVLMAIGCPKESAHGSLRVSVGRFTTREDVDSFLAALPPVVEKLRAMSPAYRSGG
jgi:cysteine desulfurase